MSTLKVTNIQDTAGGNSSTSAEIYSGRCKAWVNFNGSGTVAINASFNVSSITDHTTADYTVNFSSSLGDGNYSYVFGGFQDVASLSTAEKWGVRTSSGTITSKSGTACRIFCKNANNGGVDSGEITASFFR